MSSVLPQRTLCVAFGWSLHRFDLHWPWRGLRGSDPKLALEIAWVLRERPTIERPALPRNVMTRNPSSRQELRILLLDTALDHGGLDVPVDALLRAKHRRRRFVVQVPLDSSCEFDRASGQDCDTLRHWLALLLKGGDEVVEGLQIVVG